MAELPQRQPGRYLLGACLLAGVIAVVAPLGDPDLPEHLAMGEWIVRHGAVPWTEPFAWTRTGQPYYAYSWISQVAFYGILRALGPLGLHLLHALIAVAAVLAGAALARRRGWSPGVGAALGAINFAALATVANELRPQQLLFVLVPLAWALAYAAANRPRSPAVLLGLFGVGCLAANTHLFFPLTAAPLALLWLGGGAEPHRGSSRAWVVPAAGALCAGWLVSPYALAWPAVFRLNFAPNPMLRHPSRINEMQPGFEALFDVFGAAVLAIVLLALPWIRPLAHSRPDSTRAAEDAPGAAGAAGERAPDAGSSTAATSTRGRLRALRPRVVEALAWALGLAAFAFAYRLLAVWWLLLLPAVGERLRTAAAGMSEGTAWRRGLALAVAGLMISSGMPPSRKAFALEGDVRTRTLPTPAAAAARPLATWLLCHTAPAAGGRLLNSFNFGSYLTWRLPRYSVSIDGRTIFPDSVAREFSYATWGARNRHARTWAHAEVAIVPSWLVLGDSLARDAGWQRLAWTRRHGGAVLFARKDWWARWRRPPSCEVGPPE